MIFIVKSATEAVVKEMTKIFFFTLQFFSFATFLSGALHFNDHLCL